ncbi:MAG: sensor histidine kinase, partial [Bacteroidia bacterium]
SIPNQPWYNQLITIPYIFVLLYLVGFVVWFLRKFPWKFKFQISFKYRIQYAIVGLLMLFFLILVSGTIYYTVKQSNTENHRLLQDKLKLIKQEINGINLNNVPLLTNYLRRLSSIIYADINIYNPSGNLITSSRMEIFNKRLQSPKMSFSAYVELLGEHKTSCIHLEEIGNLSYLSAYESILDENNKVVGYINLPYFLKSEELKHKMFNLILAGINLHLLIILLAIILSVFLANKLTRPLRTIQNRLKTTRIGTYGEAIEYKKHDEIGDLVKAYNEMQAELKKSADKLALSERESAWHEMARQIAHEIKNPLTPMKLSIQFLQRRFSEHSADREEQFQKVSNTLIEQINALSAIATAFSSFAKMPPANNQQQDLV